MQRLSEITEDIGSDKIFVLSGSYTIFIFLVEFLFSVFRHPLDAQIYSFIIMSVLNVQCLVLKRDRRLVFLEEERLLGLPWAIGNMFVTFCEKNHS